jgi:hypothetical protein
MTPLPYLYSYYTGQSAVAPPYPGKAELIAQMRKYGARRLWNPPNPEFPLNALYPGAPESLAPEFAAAGPALLELRQHP